MNRNHLSTLVTATALTLVPATAWAGEGDATALHVDGVVTASDCHAEQGQSNCTGLSVLGSEVSGTNQEGEGESEDSLGSTKDAGVPEDAAEVTLFRNRSTVDGNGDSSSESDGVYVSLGGGAFEARVLHADADSNGDAHSDGVRLSGGGEEIHVLHAESKGGKGSSAVAQLFGTDVISDEDTGGVFCPLDANPILGADLICASGATAGVVDNGTVGDGTVTGEIVTVNSRDPQAPNPEAPTDGVAPSPNPLPAPFPPLARTGADLFALLLAGGLTIAGGEYLRRRGGFVSVA